MNFLLYTIIYNWCLNTVPQKICIYSKNIFENIKIQEIYLRLYSKSKYLDQSFLEQQFDNFF